MGAVAPQDVPRLYARLLAGLESGSRALVVLDVRNIGRPDVASIDALTRLRLTARRAGAAVQLRHTGPELAALLDLLGLDGVIVPSGDTRRDIVPPSQGEASGGLTRPGGEAGRTPRTGGGRQSS